MYEYFHEVEAITLESPVLRSTAELMSVLLEMGFTRYEDVWSLDRKDASQPWQHNAVIELEVLCDGQEVFEFEEGVHWNALCLKYLFASLPFECVNQFVDVAFCLSQKLDVRPVFDESPIEPDALKSLFAEYREEVLATTGEDVGSEGLEILILSTYPRH